MSSSEDLVYVLEFSKDTSYEDITWLLRQLKESGVVLSCGRLPSADQVISDNDNCLHLAAA